MVIKITAKKITIKKITLEKNFHNKKLKTINNFTLKKFPSEIFLRKKSI